MISLGHPPTRVPVRVIVFAPVVEATMGFLSAGCDTVDLRDRLDDFAADPSIAGDLGTVEAVLTSGIIGLRAEHMDRLPNLRLVACFGVGYENVDTDAAAQRGIAVTNAPATNGETVADHAVMLMMMAARRPIELDRAAREGRWDTARRAYRPTLNGSAVGVVGLGAIGTAIAARVAAFDASVAYCARSAKSVPYRFEPDVEALARDCQFLVVAVPGGRDTRHMIGHDVLRALGPQGILVNVGRGSVVDSLALAEALSDGAIYGAGLDVVEEEPDPPAALIAAPNLVMTPHMAGRSPIGLRRQCERALENIARMSRGEPLVARVA